MNPDTGNTWKRDRERHRDREKETGRQRERERESGIQYFLSSAKKSVYSIFYDQRQ